MEGQAIPDAVPTMHSRECGASGVSGGQPLRGGPAPLSLQSLGSSSERGKGECQCRCWHWVKCLVTVGLFFAATAACSGAGNPNSTESAIPQWTLVEELRLGSVDGDGPDVFGSGLVLEATADGTLFVADQQHSEIRVFNRQGRHLRTIGRAGSGPGAFRDLLEIAFDPEGRLWVADFANRRYSIFGSDLELEETRPYSDAFRSGSWVGPIDREGALHNHTQNASDF
jgi:hypothetical protein